MGEWKKVKLGDCIKEVVEKTTENNQHQVLSVTKDGIFSQEEFFKKQIASENNIGYKVIRRNNLVFSTMNLWMGSLDVLTNYDIGIVSPAYKIFKFNEELMLPSYGNYFMKSYYMLEQYKNCSEQGASIVRRNLDLKALLNININIPLIAEQEKIVKILGKVDVIIEKYEELLKEKNQFIKSQFVEMFGNGDYKKVEIKTISDIRGRVGWKGYTKSDLRISGPLVLGATHLTDDGLIDLSEPVFLSREKYEESPEIMIEQNDIIFAQRGSLGKVGLVKENIGEATINPCVLILRPKGINPEFLRFLLIMEYYNGNLERLNSGSTIPMISQKTIGEYKIILPSDDLQNRFERIVQLIDKQKFELKKIIENYKKLKRGLMQQLLTGKIRVKK